MSLIGLILFSGILVFLIGLFKEKRVPPHKGKSLVVEKNHTLILGFGNRTLEIIRELTVAKTSKKDTAVVVLANEDREVMDDFFDGMLPVREKKQIITRSGSISHPLSLKRVNITKAKSVIVLNNALSSDSLSLKRQADDQVLKTMMAIVATTDTVKVPIIVAKLFFEQNRYLAESISPGNILTIDEDKILAKILVQISRSPGLSLVYSDLIGLSGNKISFSPVPLKLCHFTFGEIQFHLVS